MENSRNIWIVDDDKSIRWVLEKAFTKADFSPRCFEDPTQVLAELENEHPDVIISDIRMQKMDGISLLEKLKERVPDIPVIIMTAYSDLDRAVSAFREGAFEYLSKPFDVDEIVGLVERALREKQQGLIESEIMSAGDVSEIIGSAPAMQEVFRAIARLSSSKLSVLITGESGTGKELVAKALHVHSPRAEQPFIALNTAAIPRELLESELFGHEKGAFTGAAGRRTGRFEQADTGTLFLDEIGDMPADLQTRLLRVLADGEFYRVGGHTPIKVDVRIIAATHQDIEERVKEGSFREDLLHRLNVIRVHVPPLRERPEDIVELLNHFLKLAAAELKIETKKLVSETEKFLLNAEWSGNVRQLENFCRWVTVMAPGRDIHVDDLPPELRGSTGSGNSATDWEAGLFSWINSNLENGETNILGEALPKFERIMIEAALQKTQGKRQEAAKLLGWGRNTLTRKINELNL
ncbi:MAG: two-component system nitrogen regulation response regulator GlnG [Gammaproteobacteria bacterium]|jgi:two-component system nitrogen regulation response regulator GlnG